MISGGVYIDLKHEPDVTSSQDRRTLSILEQCPDGARVIVDIGNRAWPPMDVAIWLHRHDHRLAIEIIGQNPKSVARFIAGARSGESVELA